MPFLSSLSFAQPLILLAFIALPLLWFLLRVIPPQAKIVKLPTYRFVKDLAPKEQTSQETPLWLLLLRLLIASLIILGFAGPILNARSNLPLNATPRLVIDNSWSGAAHWQAIQDKATALLEEAERNELSVRVMLMAEDPNNIDLHGTPLTASQALARVKALEPQPWGIDAQRILGAETAKTKEKMHSFFLSSGLAFKDAEQLLTHLNEDGGLSISLPQDYEFPFLLKISADAYGAKSNTMNFTLHALKNAQKARILNVQALGQQGSVIFNKEILAEEWNDNLTVPISLDLPSALARKIKRVQLKEQKTIGSSVIVDPSLARKFVGIVQIEGKKDNKAYIGTSFYLKRALEPYADILQASLGDILKKKPSVIILPDEISLFPSQLNDLQEWMHDGGILLRFAGPRLAENKTDLSPVRLRLGGRSLEGDVSWDKAKGIAEFDKDSPFYGLEISSEIKVKQMVLAEPSQDLDKKIWARLDDGTPLVTFSQEENGLLILIHTASTPDWSSIPLSGLYVSMIKRIIDLSTQGKNPAAGISGRNAFSVLDPVYVLGAYGQPTTPPSTMKAISVSRFMGGERLSPELRAGLYARNGLSQTINLADAEYGVTDHGQSFAAIDPAIFPFTAQILPYSDQNEQRPGDTILLLALLALIFDLVACLFLLKGSDKRAAVKACILFGVFTLTIFFTHTSPALAQEDATDPYQYANALHLAYVETGDQNVDEVSQDGLEQLARALNQRTSVEPQGVAAINLQSDELSFFPIIYWPVTETQGKPGPSVIQKIQRYLDHGGMILFDIKGKQSFSGNQSSVALKRLIGPLSISPLEITPEDHVLRRSFYLLDSFPGRYPDFPLWVERHEETDTSEVSAILIGSNDWASAWSKGSAGRQNEMATRFGINLVMYALTGNYKKDQVHVKHILERLGQ